MSFIPHGHCYLWKPGLVGLHVISDSLIALAYYSIPVTLVSFVRKRQDLPFDWIFLMFSAFILACGTTHLMEVWTLWHPDYWLSGFIKVITAGVSLGTAVSLVQLIPKALELPSPAQLEKEIKERRAAEAKLKNALQRLTFHVENSPLAVIEWDNDYRVQRWSEQAEHIFGWTAQEVLNQQIDKLQLVFADDVEVANTTMSGLLDGSIPRSVSCNRNYTKDHSVIHCEWYNSALRDESGNLVSILSLALDITSRKQAEEALKQAKEELEVRVEQRTAQLQQVNDYLERERQQLRQIITVAPVAMAMFDTQMRYMAHSQKWLTAKGIEGQSIIGRSHYEMFPDLPERWKRIHQEAINGAVITNPEDMWQHTDGSIEYIRWAIHPWYSPDGEVGGIVIASDQINELVEAREAAFEAARLKSQFLANMSHEIRTPMNGVLGLVELLLQTPLTQQQQDYTRTIRSSAQHLLNVINDILDFSKLEAGEMPLEQIDFNLDTCLDSVVDVLAAQAETKGLELAILVESNVPRQLRGDPGRLRQVLLNLLGNAVKFTDVGEVLVKVSVSDSQQAGQPKGCLIEETAQSSIALRFEVIDTGIGISAVNQQKLFQPFSQVDASTTRQYGGTGLGLVICQQLVELMGGKIGVESVLGQGSTFWFIVSLGTQPLPLTQAVPLALRQLKLLVSAEHTTTRQAVRSLVEAWGMQLDEATDSITALNVLRSSAALGHPYDVAIVDQQLPDSQGAMLVPMIRCDPNLAHTKLIVLTTMHHIDAVQELEAMDISGYLIKPVRASQLFDSLLSAVAPEEEIAGWTSSFRQTPTTNPSKSCQSDLKILLVEDHPVNQMVILHQLEMLGYEADCVENGSEALAQLQTQNYDIVLMDCQMPVLDGYEATQELRRREDTDRHTVVIALTAHALPADREKCLAAGMDDYLSKPFDQEALGATLEPWIKPRVEFQPVGTNKMINSSDNTIQPQVVVNPSEETISVFKIDETLLDGKRLESISRSNAVLQKRLLQAFVENAQPGLKQMQQALQLQDFKTIEQQAHRIKGASANVGVRVIPDITAQLEQQARQQQLIGAAENVEILEQQLQKIQAFLESMG
ncbi:response regulator [Coleofasciculus sp. LEGE 07092]|uniref:hybrid sensor histidine kinase/response regulator n=1 Tax=Coleofasciculus sp. LEGE 07092 TaxID=2777969 RepID=UPI00187FD789|nr:response regulator [Coleofasciculus sp. LEGE 07092]MBE9129546.1 response regulator [Coleofasciculus sp. LEGE 07081]MBE9151670.1 response regulator [Coleofasciculus sp. LEGE 07092]